MNAEKAQTSRVVPVAPIGAKAPGRGDPRSRAPARVLRSRIIAAAACLHLVAAGAALPRPVAEALAAAGVPESAASAMVMPVEGGAPVVRHNADAAFNPASVMKVLTAYAALELLGPAFRFRTDFLSAGELANGVLRGNLHVRAGGDPGLTYERLWRLAHQLRARGLREIRGDIVIDRGYFAPGPPHDPGKFDGDPRRAYNVGPDAFLVNFNVVDFRFLPEGATVRVAPEPDLPNVEVASRLRAVPGACGNYRAGITHEVLEHGMLASISFSGTYPSACGEKRWALAVLDSKRFAEANLRWAWSLVGGVLHGTVREGPVPPEARLLHRHESEPLSVLVRDMNKHSNNVMARHLFLALSAEPSGAGGEPLESAGRLARWLRDKRIPAPELVLENGSGLSRGERASAATIAALLRDAWSSAVMPELVASLPILAIDGTLRTRRAGPAAGQAHLKGGTLKGVQSVAGYVLDARGRRWVVAMTINHPAAGSAQPALDALVLWTWASAGGAQRGRAPRSDR